MKKTQKSLAQEPGSQVPAYYAGLISGVRERGEGEAEGFA